METPDLAVIPTPESAGENLTPEITPKSGSSSTLTPPSPHQDGFVPPLNPRGEDERGCHRLYSMGHRCGLSIESAVLEFTRGRDLDRSVYGTIYINSNFFKVLTVYNRTSGEAETVSGGGGGRLRLCGPKYFVDTFSPTAIYVDLREVGKASSLIHQMVLLPLSDIAPSKSVSVVGTGEEATLTIHMTAICPSIPTKLSLELSYPDSCIHNEWLVSGTVTATQALRKGKKKRSVCLFKRRADDPMRALKEDGHVSPGRHKARIIPDREVFVAPLWFEKSYIEKLDKLLEEAGHPSSGMDSGHDTYNGVGSYLIVDVDLKFVDSVDETKSSIIRGVHTYQFKCTHEHSPQFRATLKGPVLREKKEPKLPRLSTDIDDDEIEVTLTLVPYAEIAPDMADERYEAELPLYTKLDLMSDSSDSSSAGYMFSDDEQVESKDEEMLPVTDQMDEVSSTPITDQNEDA